VRDVAEGLVARGHRVTVLVTSTHAHDEIIHTHEGRLTIIKAARALHAASTPISPAMVWHARRLTDVDVVHLHFPFPPGDLVARMVPGAPPLVISYHSDIVRQRRMLQVYRPILQSTLRRAAAIIATSPAYIATSPWLQPHAARCVVVPYGIHIDRFAATDAASVARLQQRYGERLLLFVGQLRYYKGLPFLLQAMERLSSDTHLLLVGRGPEEERLQHQAASSGIAQRVHFLGEMHHEELSHIYRAARVFVLPSHLRSEAFGIVLIEAQAAGLPIVCTELGTGTSYITQHGVSGFVVPPADPPALARALAVVLANPQMARAMGARGQARVQSEFTHTRMLERIEQVYARCR
jgi:rhamnosyl/mannosyltransferase